MASFSFTVAAWQHQIQIILFGELGSWNRVVLVFKSQLNFVIQNSFILFLSNSYEQLMTATLCSGLSSVLLGYICFLLNGLMIFNLITCGCEFSSIEREVERVKIWGKMLKWNLMMQSLICGVNHGLGVICNIEVTRENNNSK